MKSRPAQSLLTKIIGLYTAHTPVSFALTELREFGLQSFGFSEIKAESIDGIQFSIRILDDISCSSRYYDGTYETGTLDVLKRIVKYNDVIFYIGANLGGYTMYLAKLLPVHHCHAFEPVPTIYP